MSARNNNGRVASQRISKTKETIEGKVATEPNTANAKTTVKPRFLNDENVVTATRSVHGTRSDRVSRNTTPPRRKVRPNDMMARDAMSSGWANKGPRVEPAVATTRKKNEMLTALPRKSTARGNRRRNPDATSGTWEISFEYAGKPPVAKPTTRPEATIVGKLRHGRNTSAGDGRPLKSLPHHRLARNAPTIASAIANFRGNVSRSSIQNRRTG